jgi:hypothetical protein
MPRLGNILPVLVLSLFAAQAAAQTYRCVGKDGKKYYGQSVPPQCAGLPVEQLNAAGMVVKKIDATATADERAKKEAEDADRKKREALSKEEGRRDRALLATYTSEKDVEDARRRALEGNELQMKEIEAKIAALQKRRSSKKEDAKNVDIDLKAQEGLLATKRKEVEMINARYDDEKKRYGDLTRRK